jgi:hypothetical protein
MVENLVGGVVHRTAVSTVKSTTATPSSSAAIADRPRCRRFSSHSRLHIQQMSISWPVFVGRLRQPFVMVHWLPVSDSGSVTKLRYLGCIRGAYDLFSCRLQHCVSVYVAVASVSPHSCCTCQDVLVSSPWSCPVDRYQVIWQATFLLSCSTFYLEHSSH